MEAGALGGMLAEDRSEWQRLSGILDAHPTQPVHAAGAAWTSRDIYAHLARWMERSMSDLQARLEGHPLAPLPGTDDEINARWQDEDSRLTFQQARQWAWRAFEQRIRTIEAVPMDRWSRELLAVASADGGEHYRSHREWIAVG